MSSTPVRAVLAVVVAAVVIYLLFTVVFPWFDRTFVTDPVLESRADLLAGVWAARLP